MSNPSFKAFNSPGGQSTYGVSYILDVGSGVFRPTYNTDLAANVSVSGLNLTVGAVAVTGIASVSVVNTAPLPISGVVQANVTNTVTTTSTIANPVLAISGFVNTIVTGAVSASFDTTSIVLAEASGNNFLANISGKVNTIVPVSGNVTIGNTAPINISGIVSATVIPNNTDVVNALTTGNGFLSNISGKLNTIVPVSGAVTIVNTAPINISGVVTTSVSIGNIAVTGFNANIAPLAVSGTFTATVGNVAVTGGFFKDIMAEMLLSGISGVLASNLTDPAYVTGQVSGTALGQLDITRSYLPVSGVGTFMTNDTVGNLFLANLSGKFNTVVPISGAVTTTVSIGNIAVTGFNANISPLAISGIVTASVTTNNTDVVNALTTGNGFLSNISGKLNTIVPISGIVTVGNTAPMPFSGVVQSNVTNTVTTNSNITNTAPIAISGIVQNIITGAVAASVPNPLGVTGIAVDTSLPTINAFTTRFVPMGGKVVAASGAGSITGYNSTGDMAMFNISRDNGGLLVNQGTLDRTQDEVTSWVASSGIVSNDKVVFAFGAPSLADNPNRRAWFCQNLHTGALLVRFSGSPGTTGFMNVLLKGGTAVNDGNGASWNDSPAVYTGPVSISGLGGAPILANIWQL